MKLIISFEKLRKSIGKQKKNKEKNEVLRGKKVRTKLSFVVEVFLHSVPALRTKYVYCNCVCVSRRRNNNFQKQKVRTNLENEHG